MSAYETFFSEHEDDEIPVAIPLQSEHEHGLAAVSVTIDPDSEIGRMAQSDDLMERAQAALQTVEYVRAYMTQHADELGLSEFDAFTE